MTGYTYEDLEEARDSGDPIVVTRAQALAEVRKHGHTKAERDEVVAEFDADIGVHESYDPRRDQARAAIAAAPKGPPGSPLVSVRA